jgi:hypothetical protein
MTEEEVLGLLLGRFEPDRPRGSSVRLAHKYVELNHGALETIARLLRDKPSDALLHALADALESGRLKYKQPRTNNFYQDKSVALAIHNYQRNGDTVEAAKEKVIEEFGIHEDTVDRIWRQRKKLWK